MFRENRRGFHPTATIGKNGQIRLNMGAVRRYKLGDTRYVRLFYDPERNLVGIQPTDDETAEGARRAQIRGERMAVSARSFLDYYAIPYDTTRRFETYWDDEHGMVVFCTIQESKQEE